MEQQGEGFYDSPEQQPTAGYCTGCDRALDPDDEVGDACLECGKELTEAEVEDTSY